MIKVTIEGEAGEEPSVHSFTQYVEDNILDMLGEDEDSAYIDAWLTEEAIDSFVDNIAFEMKEKLRLKAGL